MIDVSAAVLQRGSRLLLCQRGHGDMIHRWEFPGGKLEPGETPALCLAREMREELACDIVVEEELFALEEGSVRLHFLACHLAHPEAEPPLALTEHEAMAWALPWELSAYDLCPGDRRAAERLSLVPPDIRVMVWDFDGTLFDTYPLIANSFCRAGLRQGATIPVDQAMVWVKRRLSYGVGQAAQAYGLDRQTMLSDYYLIERASSVPALPFPGTGNVLRALKEMGCVHYLYTHREESAVRYLQSANLAEFFDDMILGSDGFPLKPAPDALLALQARHGFDLRQAVMVGDRSIDLDAARNAGMTGILFDPAHFYDGYQTPLRVCTMAELEALVRDIKQFTNRQEKEGEKL